MRTPAIINQENTLQRYMKRVDTVPWLGEIPSHWSIRPLKFFSNLRSRSFTDGDWIETPYVTYDGIRLIQCGNIGTGVYEEQGFRCISEGTFHELGCTAVYPGDVLICRMRSSPRILAGRACLAPSLGDRMVTAVDNCIVKCAEDVDPHFLVYQLSSKSYLEYVEAIARGGTRDRISRSMLGSLRLANPPLDEQHTIAAFLDRETARIDGLIAKKQRLIELLQEKRTALISNAFTRGITTHVPPAKSAGKWLDKCPAHWKLLPLKWLVIAKITDGPHETPEILDEGVPFVSAESIQNGRINFEAKRGYISRDLHEQYCRKCRPRRDDVFLCKSGATTGKVAIVETDNEFSVWSPLAQIRAHPKKILPRFLYLAIQADYVQNQIRQLWSHGTQPNIAMRVIEILMLAVPPLEEQAAILNCVQESDQRIEALSRKANDTIDRLREYRSTLISAAVTGKIDFS